MCASCHLDPARSPLSAYPAAAAAANDWNCKSENQAVAPCLPSCCRGQNWPRVGSEVSLNWVKQGGETQFSFAVFCEGRMQWKAKFWEIFRWNQICQQLPAGVTGWYQFFRDAAPGTLPLLVLFCNKLKAFSCPYLLNRKSLLGTKIGTLET